MMRHLTEIEIESLVDRELDEAQSAEVEEHLAGCHACTVRALAATQQKQAIREGGFRFQASPSFQKEMLERLDSRKSRRMGQAWLGWMLPLAASLVIVAGLIFATTRVTHRDTLASEVLDQHIAMLAGGAQPEVLSSDQHTVRPWFQGKLPFTFNLPETLPPDTKLEGADITYIQGEPAAVLLFRIRKHRASVFVTAKKGSGAWAQNGAFARAGFHLEAEDTGSLRFIAVSDANAKDLGALVNALMAAQK
jgi:anti-sigma factor RsiW